METMSIPNSWRLANITPLHKKGPKRTVSNYRPISLTSVVCKTMETFVRDRLMDHMEKNNLFTNHQHGFRKGSFCSTQLIEVLEDWTEKIDNYISIDTIYLDFIWHSSTYTSLKKTGGLWNYWKDPRMDQELFDRPQTKSSSEWKQFRLDRSDEWNPPG